MKLKTILLLFACVIVGSLPFLPVTSEESVGLGAFIGRFHPLVLHFPIALLILAVTLELVPLATKNDALRISSHWHKLLLEITFAFATISAICGFLLYSNGEYQGNVIENHLWGGVLVTLVLALSLFCYWGDSYTQSRPFKTAYRFFLFASGLILIYTSHIGGSITHGKDFLTEVMPSFTPERASEVEQKKQEDLIVYHDLIRPALEKRCLSCHNEYKTKGGLLMTSWANLQKGGKSGKPILVSGNPSESELYNRISLPIDHDDHMPPSEKPGLDEDEIALVEWWISQGASVEQTLGDTLLDPEMTALITRYLPRLYQSERIKSRKNQEHDELALELAEFGEELCLIIVPDPASEERNFSVSMKLPPEPVDDKAISRLLKYANVFSKISLPGADISDDALHYLSQMTALEKLYVQKTPIKGEGLIYLKSLNQLQELNLSFTDISNQYLLNLLHVPNLKKCYVYGTDIYPEVLNALRENMNEMEILVVEGPYF